MYMKRAFYLLVLVLFTSVQLHAQEKRATGWIFGPSVGYQYQSGSFLKASAWGMFALNQSQYLKLDGGANFTG
uniref:Putative secreted protein n=1 Tax=Rhipicephalus microplus TaxID=6941 RepID=A0A6G5A2J4_RHIMP